MSNMQINNVVIHQFMKTCNEQNIYGKEYKLRDQENNISEIIKELIEKLQSNYEGKENSVQRGIFEKDNTGGDGEFAKYFLANESSSDSLKNLIDHCKKLYPTSYTAHEDNHFYNLSLYFMEELKNKGKSGSINGGLLFFADYIINGLNFFLVVMFEKEEGFNISDLDVEKIESIDINKLKQALRINKKLLQESLNTEKTIEEEDKKNYASFISTGSAEIREFFINAAGCRKEFSNAKATNEIYSVIKDITESYPNLKKHVWEIHEIVTDYYEDRIANHKNNINRTKLFKGVVHSSSEFCSDTDQYDGDDIVSISQETLLNKLLTFANSEKCNIPLNFKAVESEVKKKKQYAKPYKSSYIRIVLDDIGSSPDDLLYFDEETGVLQINDEELKEKIRQKKDNIGD